jgi:ribosomal protein S18 acetylase RimI-like enzyme
VRSERLLIGPLLCLIVIGPISRTLLADQDPWGDYAYFSCTDGIAFGCLTALACARWRIPAWVSRIALPAGAAGVLFVLVMRETVERIGLTKLGLHISVLELGVALMLLAFGTGFGNEAVSRGTGWLRRIGHHSYETYLFHMIVVLGLMNFVLGTHASSRTLPAWFAAMLLLSLGLGEIVARRYSEPLNRRLRTRFVAGKPTVRVSYLELRTAPGHQAAESGAAMIALERLATEDYLALYRRVGAQVRWDQRLQIPLPELESLLAGNDLRIYVLRSADGSGLGLCEFDRSGFPDIELKNFGVVPEAQGRGLGRRLLATALAREWETGLQRVWLHTDSWDHPAAMRLYSSLGFRVFEERDEPVGPL